MDLFKSLTRLKSLYDLILLREFLWKPITSLPNYVIIIQFYIQFMRGSTHLVKTIYNLFIFYSGGAFSKMRKFP